MRIFSQKFINESGDLVHRENRERKDQVSEWMRKVVTRETQRQTARGVHKYLFAEGYSTEKTFTVHSLQWDSNGTSLKSLKYNRADTEP